MLNILTALQPEARPVIDALHLKKRSDIHGFPIFVSQDVTLIISGIGKQAAAAATAFLHGLQHGVTRQITQDNTSSAWLNIGIAGSADFALEQDMLAHKITEQSNGATFYPTFCFEIPCASAEIITVDRPVTEYPCAEPITSSSPQSHKQAFDMEASAFFSTATRFTSAELVQCYKVISDTPENPAHTVNAAIASEMIAAKLATIKQLIVQLQELENSSPSTHQMLAVFNHVMKTHRLSVTQQHQLQRLLQRWALLTDKPLFDSIDLVTCRSTKRLIETIEQHIDAFPIVL